MSEAPFIALTLCAIVVMEDFLKASERRFLLFLGATVAVWLAFLFRYVGLVLVLSGAAAILVAGQRPPRSRPAWSSAFAISAALLPASLIVRNKIVGGTTYGVGPSGLSVHAFVAKTTRVVGTWIVPWSSSVNLARAAAVLLGVLIVSGLLWRRRGLAGRRVSGQASLAPLGFFTFAYAAAFAAIELRRGIEWPDDRMLSPLYVPLTVLGMVAVEELSTLPRPVIWRALATPLLIVLVVGQIRSFVSHVRHDASDGILNHALPRRVHLIANSDKLASRVRDLPADAVIYSNNPQEVWLAADRSFILQPPPKGGGASPSGDLATYVRTVTCKNVYFVWRRNLDDPFLTPAQLSRETRFDRILHVNEGVEGALYRVTPLGQRLRASCT